MSHESSTGELRVGMTIGNGRFALLRLLGSGGMGKVFEAEDVNLRRRVALKVLSPIHADNPEMVERFRREVQAAAAAKHPHIVVVHELGQRTDGSLFIVQELLPGKNLRDHIGPHDGAPDRKKLPIVEVLEIMAPIMSALIAVHDKGVVHRDLKPENIFLAEPENGTIVPTLIDFGISKMDIGVQMTQPGQLLGTLPYMAPEILLGIEIDEKVDVWAVGAVMFEMLAGRSPFEAPTHAKVVQNILKNPIPRLEVEAPDLPAELVTAVHKALDRSQADRFQSFRDFLRAITSIADRQDPTFGHRHAALLGSAGLKSVPPMALDSNEKGGIRVVQQDTWSLPETLDLPVIPSQRKLIWPIVRVEFAVEPPDRRAPGLEERVENAYQALNDNALDEAIYYAEQAISKFRPEGAILGEMRLVQAIAHRWLGDFVKSERCAMMAMSFLPHATSQWLSAAVHNGIASGTLGRNDRVTALAQMVLDLPASTASGHTVATLCHLSIMLVRGDALDLAEQLFTQARSLAEAQKDLEPEVIAALDLAYAEFALHAGDPTTYLRRVESALEKFAATGDARNACLQRANIGNAYMQLGAYSKAESLLRESLAVSEPMKLTFVTSVRANLGFALARLGRLDEALEIETKALEECIHQGYRRFEAVSRIYLIEIFSLRGELKSAEVEAQKAIEVASISPAIEAHARAAYAAVLLSSDKITEAFDQAAKAMHTLELLDGVEEGEALIRIVYVRALDATDRPRTANERLAGAQQRLRDRLDRIHDPELRRTFKENIPENALTFRFAPRSGTLPPPPVR